VLIPIQISAESADPIYHQIEMQLRDLIISGQLPPGTPLPSIRQLSQDLGCSVITTRRVYQDLENEGIIRTRKGIGTFVAEVGLQERERYKLGAVRDAFREAIRVGTRVGCTPDEMRSLLDRLLIEREEGGGE